VRLVPVSWRAEGASVVGVAVEREEGVAVVGADGLGVELDAPLRAGAEQAIKNSVDEFDRAKDSGIRLPVRHHMRHTRERDRMGGGAIKGAE